MKVGTDGVLLGAWADVSNATKILDIGTGTGVIALMLAQRSNARIDAIDTDDQSCLQAKENILNSKFHERIKVHNQSLQKFCEEKSGKYNLIVSNPPYFQNSLKSENANRNISRHSDVAELNSEILIFSALKLLNLKGKFCLILPKTEGEKFVETSESKNLFCTKITRVFSKPKKNIIRLLLEFELTRKKMEEDFLTIETGRKPNDFTEEYKKLTRNFYLNF